MSQTTASKSIKSLRNEFQSERLFPNLISILLIGFTEIIFAISLASLIFSGDLSIFLPYGIGIALASLAITSIFISLTSSVPGIITGLQESPAVIQGLVVAAIFTTLLSSTEKERLTSIIAVLIFTSLLTGLFFLALGFFKLGGLVRYIPYPVMGGFLAGTGWLLIQAAFGVMTNSAIHLSDLSLFIQPDQLLLWIPGLMVAITLIIGHKKIKHFITMPAIIIGAILLFYLCLLITGMPIAEAINRGLLIGKFSAEATWQPLYIRHLFSINLTSILDQSGKIASILILSVLNILLNTTGLELEIDHDADINHELRSAGIANILSGLGGGMIGFQALSESTLNYRLGSRGRLVGLGVGFLSILLLFTSASIISYFPKMILGGLLLFLGIDFLIEWVFLGWKKLSRIDYGIVILILIVIATTDFITGFGVGLLATVLLFVINYSQINVIHHALSGSEFHSNVERTDQQWQKLQELGEHIYILELQGFIFFGTAHSLLESIRARINNHRFLPVRFLVLDFRRVSGLDSSAIFSFIKCRQLAKSQNISILLAHVSEDIQHKFELGGFLDDKVSLLQFPDLDRGLEWCEDELLKDVDASSNLSPTSLSERLVTQGFPESMVPKLMKYLESMNIKAGGFLVRQGDTAGDLYFIESGRVSVYLELGDGHKMRLQTLSRRIIVGELGLYINMQRTASIIAEENCVVYRLSKEGLAELKEKDLDLATVVHEFIACLLARRLADTTQLLTALDQ